MPNNTDAIYDLSSSELPALPTRSRLYHLEPIGIGTPYVESLSSYTTRLAQAHSVQVRVLIAEKILPKCARPYLTVPEPARSAALRNFLLQTAQSVNGTQKWANDWVSVLQSLTLRNDLRFLTMLTWADMLNPMELMRRTKTWCPACYDEWRRDGQVIYEPLLWRLAVVTVCPRHSQPLHLRCPHKNCQQSMPVLTQRSRPGYCSRCEGWLGVPREIASAGSTVLSTDEMEWQTWVAGAVGELIASAPSLPLLPRRERIMDAVTICAEGVAGGDLFELSCLLEIDLPMLQSWQRGLKVPQLGALLRLCYVLGITPLRFLTQGIEVAEIPLRILPFVRNSLSRSEKSFRPVNSFELKRDLEEILANDIEPPLSMRQVAEKLGYSYGTMLKYYREQCRAISERFRAYRTAKSEERKQTTRDRIRQITFDLHAQGKYPNANQIGLILHNHWILSRSEAKDAWYIALRELGLSQQHTDD